MIRTKRSALLLVLALSLAFILCMVAPAPAADYGFEVPEETVRVTVNQDSSLDIDYRITFTCLPGAKAIDIVDIGMPTPDYPLEECRGSIDGFQLLPMVDIQKSTVLLDAATGKSFGVELHLGGHAIQPGSSGVVEFHGRAPNMVFRDPVHEGYASVEFKNTWWGSQYSRGTTNLTTSMVLPPGVDPNYKYWHGTVEPTWTDENGRLVATWVQPDASPSQGYLHGVSFPASAVASMMSTKPVEPSYNPNAYKTSSGFPWKSYWYVGLMILVVLGRSIYSFFRVRSAGARAKYLAPSMGIEGAGPMMDLAPGEAAVLLNQDLDRVAAVVYFEMLEKGLVQVVEDSPLRLKAASAMPENAPAYYGGFVAAIGPDGALDREALKKAFASLIKGTGEKMKGFATEDTVQYYRGAAQNAWSALAAQGNPLSRMDAFNANLPLLLLDEGFGAKVKEAFAGGGYPVQPWALLLLQAQSGGPDIASGPGGSLSVEGSELGEALASSFRGIQDGAFEHADKFKEEMIKEVNPDEWHRVYYPVIMTSRGGGGGGGGCACACAGCACACAGGGR